MKEKKYFCIGRESNPGRPRGVLLNRIAYKKSKAGCRYCI